MLKTLAIESAHYLKKPQSNPMLNLSKTVEQSSLWLRTLANAEPDLHQTERDRLRASFLSFRHRANLLSLEIAKDLPDLTVHDITHLDALWEVASQIVGSDYSLTPTEGYVLGGSILLHDLAMSIAATPGGLSAIRNDPRWTDTIHSYFHAKHGRAPRAEEISAPPEDARQLALFSLLRLVHAENAEKLAFLQFGTEASAQYLIEDTELRQTFGRIIGQIAHSHWWSLTEVEKRLDRRVGAPHWAPANWTIDPLKIACILRSADAAHVDARRSPSFQRIFSSISPASRIHWTFQERLNKSYVRDDALVFTSGQAFSLEEASAWWLCLDTLRMVDAELRAIDSLLADRSMPRFSARRVAGVDHPERLAQYIQTINWHPIHATVHLSDLPNIIRSLGGEELYGHNPAVPLRELIQNAADAIRARRSYENRPVDFGQVSVELVENAGTFTLRVIDDGIGMSSRVLTQYLLDFGSSFWSKPQVQEEFPGLLSTGFRSTGKYGIGFFSVFMASDRVKVVTRRSDAAAIDTLVLEFGSGLNGRPILRPAKREEQLRDGGTIVELTLRKSPHEAGGLLNMFGDKAPDLISLCQHTAPTLDVKLVASHAGQRQCVILPSDWTTVPGEVLLVDRCPALYEDRFSVESRQAFASRAAANLRILTNDSGEPVARICIVAADMAYMLSDPIIHGAVTVGGFTASPLQGIAGFIVGESTRAARDHGEPVLPKEKLASWASDQAALVSALYQEPESQISAAQTIRICGGSTGNLPIAKHGGSFVSAVEIAQMELPDELVIMDWFTHDYELKHAQGFEPAFNVFITGASGLPTVFQSGHGISEYGRSFHNEDDVPMTLAGAVLEAAASAWGIPPSAIVAANDLEREVDVLVGKASSGDIRANAFVIRRPLC
ncbi:HD domain-containing protein [Cupriavidus sp. CP313]